MQPYINKQILRETKLFSYQQDENDLNLTNTPFSKLTGDPSIWDSFRCRSWVDAGPISGGVGWGTWWGITHINSSTLLLSSPPRPPPTLPSSFLLESEFSKWGLQNQFRAQGLADFKRQCITENLKGHHNITLKLSQFRSVTLFFSFLGDTLHSLLLGKNSIHDKMLKQFLVYLLYSWGIIYNVLVASAQQNDSVIHSHPCILFQIPSHYRLLQYIEYSSLCYTVGPFCLLLFAV